MTITGVDYSMGTPSQAALQGFAFACRYVGFTDPSLPQTKILTKLEAQRLSNMGLSIVSNYEWYANRPQEGYNSGVWDARTALTIHANCGGPDTAPIYFSVDFLPSNMLPIGEYFKGIASVMPLSRIGAYGPYSVIQYLVDNKLITWRWQTYAWSGGQWLSGNHIEQYDNGVKLSDGTEVDLDRALAADYGQWSLTVSQTPDYRTEQFNDVWSIPSFAYQSGIYHVMLSGFLAGVFGACFPQQPEKHTVDWSGNAIQYQAMSNGLHAEYRVSDGSCRVYDARGNLVYQH